MIGIEISDNRGDQFVQSDRGGVKENVVKISSIFRFKGNFYPIK